MITYTFRLSRSPHRRGRSRNSDNPRNHTVWRVNPWFLQPETTIKPSTPLRLSCLFGPLSPYSWNFAGLCFPSSFIWIFAYFNINEGENIISRNERAPVFSVLSCLSGFSSLCAQLSNITWYSPSFVGCGAGPSSRGFAQYISPHLCFWQPSFSATLIHSFLILGSFNNPFLHQYRSYSSGLDLSYLVSQRNMSTHANKNEDRNDESSILDNERGRKITTAKEAQSVLPPPWESWRYPPKPNPEVSTNSCTFPWIGTGPMNKDQVNMKYLTVSEH